MKLSVSADGAARKDEHARRRPVESSMPKEAVTAMTKRWTEVSNSKQSIIFWTSASALFVVALFVVHASNRNAYVYLAQEDGIFEYGTALLYAVAGSVLIGCALRGSDLKALFTKQLLTLLLAAFFFFVAGEEISWGQRLFGIEVPDSIRAANAQQELTVHNLNFLVTSSLDQHRLLNLFAAMTGVVLPLLYVLHQRSRAMLNRLHFPISPLSCSGTFVLGVGLEQVLSRLAPHYAHAEHKEFIFSAAYFLFSMSVLQRKNTLA